MNIKKGKKKLFSIHTSVYLSKDENDYLEQKASETYISKSNLIRICIKEYAKRDGINLNHKKSNENEKTDIQNNLK